MKLHMVTKSLAALHNAMHSSVDKISQQTTRAGCSVYTTLLVNVALNLKVRCCVFVEKM